MTSAICAHQRFMISVSGRVSNVWLSARVSIPINGCFADLARWNNLKPHLLKLEQVLEKFHHAIFVLVSEPIKKIHSKSDLFTHFYSPLSYG